MRLSRFIPPAAMWRQLKQTIGKWPLVTVTACTAGVVIGLTQLGTFQFFDWVLLDRWFRFRPLEPRDPRIVIVSITEDDILRLRQWPMSDDSLATLIESIAAYKPRVIGLDLYRDLPIEPGHQRLVEVMRSTPQLIGIEKALGKPVAPAPELLRRNQIGAADLVVDADGTVRRGLLSLTLRDQSLRFSFGAKLALTYLDAEGIVLEAVADHPQHVRLGKTLFRRWESQDGGYIGADAGGYQVLLNFRTSHCDPSNSSPSCAISIIPMEDILNERIATEVLEDRIVVIGVMATSVRDLFYVPYSHNDATTMTGIEIHAQVASQIMSAALDGRSLIHSWPQWLEYLWVGLWAGLGMLSVTLNLRRKRTALGLLAIGGTFIVLLAGLILGSYLIFLSNWWIPIVPPMIALGGSTLLNTTASLSHRLKWSNRQLEQTNRQLEQTNRQLEQANHQLIAYSQTLEEKVAERTAELLVAKEAADNANRAKSDFLASMSHELRTPLNGVLGYAQILDHSQSLSAEDRHRVSVIYHCGTHLLTLINDILDLAKIEARKLDLYPEPLLLVVFLHSVVELCDIRAQQKGIEFQAQFSPRLPQSVTADSTRLRQVLINLVNNAIKFTDAGSVTLSVDVLNQSDTHVSLFFQVIDTGRGIAEADLPNLFGAFEQVGDRAKHSEGSGLGLAISQQIVTLMGGSIQVRSQLGQGSEFYFTLDLPLSPELTQAPVRERRIIGYQGTDSGPLTLDSERRPYRILLIDDRWENREILRNLLEPIGFKILISEEGQDGLNLLQTQSPDAVILDLVMPGMNGFEVLNTIRHSDNLKHHKVIVSSASVAEADREKAITHGGDYFLPKPVDAQLLFTFLSQCLALEWVYDESGAVAQHSTTQQPSALLTLPPVQQLKALLVLAESNHIKALRHQLEQLRLRDERYGPFVEPIFQLAQQFQLEEIETLLKRYIAQQEG